MMEDKRKHIINEVIETERAYVSFLSLLVQAYAKPLKELAKAGRGVLDVHSVRSIFSDVETIHFFNSQLLADLSAASASGSPLGDIFLRMGTGLKLYTSYINNYGAALQELKKQQANATFRAWLEQTKAQNLEQLKRNDLSSLLVMPIQRIPRYILLLKDLHRSTDPVTDTEEHAKLGEAVQMISELAQYIDQSKRTSDNFLRLAEIQKKLHGLKEKLIQPHRRFIHEGKVVLTKQGVASTLERTLYLFNDILIIAKEEEKESRGGRMMQFKCLSSVSAITVEPEESSNGCSFRLTCHLTSLNASPQESKLIVTVASPSHVKEWIAKFDEAIGDTKHKWTLDLETKPLGDKRRLWLHGSAAARCGDMVYFFGGSTAARFRKCLWTLDLNELTWMRRKKTGKGPSPRRGHSATAIKHEGEDVIVLIGGIDGRAALGDVHLFQCSNFTWLQEKAKLANSAELGPRSGHSATLVEDCVYVLGGKDDGGVHYTEVSILDTRTWRWNTAATTTGEAPPGLCSHSATAVGRRIFVVGGRRSDGEASRRIYILNTEDMSWTAGPDFPALAGHKASAYGDDIFLVGGTSSPGNRNQHLLFVLRTESLAWEQVDVSGVEGFPDIEENYSLMLTEKKALLVHSSQPTHAVGSRQSQSVDSAISVLRLESTEKRIKLLSSPPATYGGGESGPSPRVATTTSADSITGASPRRKASASLRNRRNTLGKRRGLESQSSYSSFYDDSASEGRSSVDFSADSDSASERDHIGSRRRHGSFCSDSEAPSPASSRAASPRVTIEAASSALASAESGTGGMRASDAQTSEEENDWAGPAKQQPTTKRDNKWKRFTRSFSVGNMWKSQEISDGGGAAVEEDGEQSPALTPSSARNSAQMGAVPHEGSAKEELLALLNSPGALESKQNRSMSLSAGGLKTRAAMEKTTKSPSPRADGLAAGRSVSEDAEPIRTAGKARKSFTISGRRKSRAALLPFDPPLSPSQSPDQSSSGSATPTGSPGLATGQSPRKYATLKSKHSPVVAATSAGNEDTTPRLSVRSRTRLGSSSSAASPRSPAIARGSDSESPPAASATHDKEKTPQGKGVSDSAKGSPTPKKQLSVAQRLSFKNLLHRGGDKERH